MGMIIHRRRARTVVVPASELEYWPFTPPPRRIKPIEEPGPDLPVVWLFVGVALAMETALLAFVCLVYL